jgi:putative tricarboxylic transport membrane protein
VTGLMPTKRGFQAHGRADPARHRHRLGARHPARRRGDPGLLRLLHDRKESLEDTREEFGKGAIEGVAGPESANNAGAQTSFIPMLTLGIPANPVMALMIGAMIIQGIVPGPERRDRAAGAVLGHHRLDVDRQPDAGRAQPAADRLWVKLLTVPYYVLFPIIMAFCSIGVYSVNSNIYDLYAVAFFGLLGYC